MCKCDAVCEHLEQSRPHLVALQEIDVPEGSASSFVVFWSRRGYHVVLSAGEQGGSRACVLSRLPVSPLRLDAGFDSRIAACLVELKQGDKYIKSGFSSVYAYPSDYERTNKLATNLFRELHLLGLPFLCLGDWQEEASDPPYAQLLASGCVHNLDDSYIPWCLAQHGPWITTTHRFWAL